MGNWLRINFCEDYLDSRYVETFRLDYTTFHWLLSQVEGVFFRDKTHVSGTLSRREEVDNHAVVGTGHNFWAAGQ